MRKIEALSNYKLELIYSDISNAGKRESQQDCFGISDFYNHEIINSKGILSVVADGMGGMRAGDESSKNVVETVLGYFESTQAEGLPDYELLKMINLANGSVKRGSGSTIAMVNVIGNQLYFASVGDSHIYLQRGGKLIQLNREHVFSTQLDNEAARGEISILDAYENRQRQALSSYLGMGKLCHIDNNTNPIQLISKDQIILATDGIYNTLSQNEIVKAVIHQPATKQGPRLQRAIEKKNNPDQDNYTALILTIK